MSGPGFYVDDGAMKVAFGKLGDARESLGAPLVNFRAEAALDSAIPSLSGEVPIVAPGMGPDIDQVENLIAQNVLHSYTAAVDAVDGLLQETAKKLDDLSRGVSDSLQEYQRRDEESSSGFSDIDIPG